VISRSCEAAQGDIALCGTSIFFSSATPTFSAGLLARGYSEAEVKGLIGGNWLSFMERHDAA
jgi:hypothetical protein